ncbi:MAG TPA: ribonuclease D [Gammaproteobacteria bacterium]
MEGLIDDEAALGGLCELLERAKLVAIDTEFVRERTYYPQLCLVQVATDDCVACVDCLADLDLGPFFACLARRDLTWVLHSGRQDLEVVHRHAGVLPATLVDTQIAAALTGRAAQIGLREILAAVLGVDIGKDHTRADWSARPLPEGPLRYALDDVRHLLELWRSLERDIERLGRRDWLAEDCARLVESAGQEDLLPVWLRIKGVQGLPPDEQTAAYALVLWRETTARALDRPRRWIMSDELLARIAAVRPTSVSALRRIPEMPQRLAQRFGDEIVAAVGARGSSEHLAALERAGNGERPDRDALKALQAKVKARADVLGIEAEVLASRRDLAAWLRGAPPPHLRSGWRAAELAAL